MMRRTNSEQPGTRAPDADGTAAAVQPTTRPARGRARRRRWIIASVLVALSSLLGAALVQVTAATADAPGRTAPDYDYVGENTIRDYGTGECLMDTGEVDYTGASAIKTSTCISGDPDEEWMPIFQYESTSDVVAFEDVGTGRCLFVGYFGNPSTVASQYCDGSGTGGTDYTYWLAQGTWTEFNIIWVNETSGPQCLDSNTAGSVYDLGCNGGGNQDWKFGY